MAHQLPVELLARIIAFCDRPSLVVAATAFYAIQREAEALMYEHVEIATRAALDTFCATILSEPGGQGRRAGLVRRLVLADADMSVPFDDGESAPFSLLRGSVVPDMLSCLRNLESCHIDWIGPSRRTLNALSTSLRSLSFCFDVDDDAVAALITLQNLQELHIRRLPLPHNVGNSYLRPHVCQTLDQHPSALPRLTKLQGPMCCTRVLAKGRPIRIVMLDTLLAPDTLEEDLAALATGSCPVNAVQLAVADNGQGALSILSRHRDLRTLAFVDRCVHNRVRWATAQTIQDAVCLFPRLQAFSLVTPFRREFRPAEDSEDELRALIARWADASPSRDLWAIYIANVRRSLTLRCLAWLTCVAQVEFNDAGPVSGSWMWRSLWNKRDGMWAAAMSGWCEV